VKDCVRVTACRLCDGPLDLIVSFTPTPLGDQYLKEPQPQACYPLDLMTCRSCGAVQLADTVNPAAIYTDYIYTTSISPGLDEHFDRYAESVLERVKPKRGAFVVDIGSNDGTLLKAFDKRGCFVAGVEPAERIAELARESDIPTYCGFFGQAFAEEILQGESLADIITANHVMANVPDLHDFIKGVKTLLAPDGTFVFETGYWPAIMRNRLIDTIEHEHIHYFAATPLASFFLSHGLTLGRVEEQPTKGGSLRGYVRHVGDGPVWTSPLLAVTERASLDADHQAALACEISALRSEIGLCVATKPKSERWVGYGAAVGSTLLCHHFGLGDVLTELWDDNSSRHGLVSPGFHLPVVAPNSSQPDRIVILAWRYADRIMAAHPEHAGKWIIPLPSLRFT
jgi:SAM-dependent methyltransferase